MNNKIKILILSQYYYPDVTAAAFRVSEIAEILERKGYEVTVITARPHKAKIKKDSGNNNMIRITRVPLIKYRNGGKLSYILHYSSFMINSFVAGILIRKCNPDIVFSTSPPLFVGIGGALVSIFKRSKFVLDVRDIWPDSAVAAGLLRNDGLFFKVAKFIEKKIYLFADLISCVSDPMGKYIRDIAPNSNIMLLYNAVPERYLSIESSMKTLPLNYNKEKINLLYVGNFGRCQDLSTFLYAAKSMQDAGKDGFIFYLVGAGIERNNLIDLKNKLGLKNVLILGPVSKQNAICLIKLASAVFFQLKDDDTLKKTIPSKLFDYMVAGKPILYGIEGEGREILSQIEGNIWFKAGSAKSFKLALIKLSKCYPNLLTKSTENRIIVEKKFTREKVVDKLDLNFRKILNKTMN